MLEKKPNYVDFYPPYLELVRSSILVWYSSVVGIVVGIVGIVGIVVVW